MSTLYKYLNLMSDQYFITPTMKISIATHFNDPFESARSNDVNDIITRYLKNIYRMSGDTFDEYFDITSSYIDSKICGNGIISLSETNDNMLMWAHYADNHKGMCIGLDEDFAAHKIDKPFSEPPMPLPVAYGKNRLDLDKRISIDKFPNDLYMAHILNKFDKWEYEKEKRVLIPIHLAEKVILNPTEIKRKVKLIGGAEFEYSISGWLPILIKDRYLEEIIVNDSIHYIPTKDIDFSAFALYLGMFEEATFLMSIPPKKIKEIYFGCKTPEHRIKSIYKILKSPESNLKHVKLFKYHLSPDKFELIPKPINNILIDDNSV